VGCADGCCQPSLKKKAGPLLYANSKAATNDIAIGNNSVFGVTGFSAKSGWDACTGLGSPNGAKLLALLSSPGVPKKPHQVLLQHRPTPERS